MKPEEFELVETVDRDALARHPLWKVYRAGDRARILSSGVAPERLDAELERFAYCGPEPLFPVLDCETLPEGDDLCVAVRFRLAAGPELPGWRLGPLAFGVFAGPEGQEFVFNRGLPAFSRRTAERLAERLGIAPDAVFPLRYRSSVRGPDGTPLSGEIAAPW